MDYKNKYLKYKSKYLNLKKQIGLGKKTYHYTAKVPEFESNTKDGFINSKERNLNTLTIVDNIDVEDYNEIAEKILKNKDKIEITAIKKEDLLKLITEKSKELVEIEGFFNIMTEYKLDKDIGTYVKTSDLDEVFKIKPSNITSNGFEPYKGTGKKNLNQTMKTLKETGVKYVILEAAGKEGLVNLYSRYGFESILKGYDFYYEGEIIGHGENHIMFALIDTIIAKTN